jgi:hypothetical protein
VPVIESDDLRPVAAEIAAGLARSGVSTVVVSGFPDGSDALLSACRASGIATRCVLHSSTAQHGAEAGEAAVADRVLTLAASGVIERVGFVKAGMAEALSALGHPAWHVPNRVPDLPDVRPIDSGEGTHIGVFAEPFWRKNVVTQLAAVALLPGATAHVMRRPEIGYLDTLPVVEHGEVPWNEFLSIQAGMDLTMYVTLSECHPLSPVESYLTGVPSLISRTSALFADDPELWELTTVEVADDPTAIAAAATRLIDNRDDAVRRAVAWLRHADGEAAARWEEFVSA